MGMKNLDDFYAHKDAVEECHSDCEQVAMEVIARAADGEKDPLCPEHKASVLRQFILDACIQGVRKYTDECIGIHGAEFVEFGGSESLWQQFILGEQDGELKMTYKITITETQEEW